eukprot:m.201891 g.201891  ORF g.201891 m.201891 type:complete len:75 (+) comp14973_c3_seq1:1504-1728(+)
MCVCFATSCDVCWLCFAIAFILLSSSIVLSVSVGSTRNIFKKAHRVTVYFLHLVLIYFVFSLGLGLLLLCLQTI